jgi:hypothetical protein
VRGVVQLLASIAVLLIGLYLALLSDAGDFRVFGWLLVGLGVFGLVSRSLFARR